jgi:hypothetical protein
MPSSLVSHDLTNYLQVGFPLGWHEHPRTLEFKQSSFCHIGQVLRNRQGGAYFLPVFRFTPRLCVPLTFRLVSGKGVNLWGTLGNFPRRSKSAMNFRRETAHSVPCYC